MARVLERLSGTKMLLLFSLIYIIAMFFVANIALALVQATIRTIQQFQADANNITFSFDWGSMFDFQPQWIYFYVGFYMISGFGLLKFMYNVRVNFKSLDTGQHGTGEFESVKELKKQYKIIPGSTKEFEGDGGTIISALQEKGKPYRLLIDDGPVHSMVIGITRSGKGETFVFPMIDVQSRAENKPSLVINDPKGELAAASYETLLNRGYDVHVFNLLEPSMGMGFNPLQLVVDAWKKGNSNLAQQYANSIAYSLYHDPNAKDPFWSNSAKSLVTAIILAITEDSIATGQEEKVTLYSVANFLSSLGSDNDEETGENALDQFFKARSEINPARMMYATSNFAAGNTRASIFSTAMDKLQIFTLEPNARLTSYNSIDLTAVGFGDKPVALFMVTPDFDESNHVLASIFVSQLYRVNAEKATMSPSGKMSRPVHFLLDEFGNMPTVEGMASMVTVGAGRGFRFHLIVQAYSQLKSSYGDEADTIIGNCSNQIYILTKDKSTAEQYSALIGNKTIVDVSRSGSLYSFDKSHSESTKERALLMPDELMKLKEGESVVVRANKRQDKKRRKIVPKPIFNTGVTAAKFRYEYLAADFKPGSVLSLPISSAKYHSLNLNNLLFTSKSEANVYLQMKLLLDTVSFKALEKLVQKESNSLCSIETWSFLELLSFITYETSLSHPIFVSRIKKPFLEKYIPDKVLLEWEEELKKVRDERNLEEYDQEALRQSIIGGEA